MSKFRIKMKLQGLELEIEGSREDVPLITRNIERQLAGLVAPAAGVVDGKVINPSATAQQQLPSEGAEPARKLRRRRLSTATATGDSDPGGAAVDWRHDPSKHGSPKQGWTTAEKAIWTLHVVAAEADIKEMSGKQITNTFNKHFRQAGRVLAHNVNRDLGVLKVKKGSPTLVSEDTTLTPGKWYLTDEGQRKALELVADALGRSA